MKVRNILLVLLLLYSTMSFAQDKLFDKYSEMDNVTSVYISKSMFQLMPDLSTGDMDFSNLKGKIDNLQILTSEDKEVTEKMKADFNAAIDKSYELLMKVKSDDTRATFYVKQKGEQVNEMLMLTDDKDDYVVIRLLGNFTVQDIQSIANSVGK